LIEPPDCRIDHVAELFAAKVVVRHHENFGYIRILCAFRKGSEERTLVLDRGGAVEFDTEIDITRLESQRRCVLSVKGTRMALCGRFVDLLAERKYLAILRLGLSTVVPGGGAM